MTSPRSRPPFPPPQVEDGVSASPGHISINHPGYDEDRELFRFVAYDITREGIPWIDYNFVYDMCMAITNYAKAGFFTHGKAPNLPKISAEDGVLLGGVTYYFHVGNDDTNLPEQYAVIRGIRDYQFSTAHVGDHWRTAVPRNSSEEWYTPDACIVSGEDGIGVDDAHLVPKTEWEFWKTHSLHNYTLQAGSRTYGREMSTRSNIIRLTPTLHRMFDAGHFVLIPVYNLLRQGTPQ